VKVLEEYIRIPNQSPMFDAEVHTNGLQEKATDLLLDWVLKQGIKNLSHQVVKDDGRTPVLLFEVPAHKNTMEQSVLMYGHLDKQPPMTEGWSEGLGPHKPVIRDGKLYGRGGADDGYSVFAAITAIRALQDQDAAHPRVVILIEACEESGSADLPHYLDRLESNIGNVGLIVCLDSGCGNYEQLWVTTSLRGVTNITLRVDVLEHGVHSGAASGVVPSSFRCIRGILDQLEDVNSGVLKVPELSVDIPEFRVAETKKCAEILGKTTYSEFPFVEGVQPVHPDIVEMQLNKTWRPTMSVIGVDGIPSVANAGNVLRQHTTLALSFRLPPTCDAENANKGLQQFFKDVKVPCNGKITTTHMKGASGWSAPKTADWLKDAAENASQTYFGKPCVYMGEGGSIPFMGLLGKKFPEAQFLIVGVLGPHSNAHGPDEFLHIPFAKKLTACITHVMADLGQRTSLK